MNASNAITHASSPRTTRWLRHHRAALMLVLLSLAVPQLLWGYFSQPVVLQRCLVRQPTQLLGSAQLEVTAFLNRDGRPIATGGKLCFDDNRTQLRGRTELPDGTHLRLFQRAARGEYYLHEPDSKVRDGQWSFSGIDSGNNIRALTITVATPEVSAMLSRIALKNAYAEQAGLPEGVQQIAAVPLAREEISSLGAPGH